MVPLLDRLVSPFGVPPSLEDSSSQGLKGRWRRRWKPGCAALRRVVTSVRLDSMSNCRGKWRSLEWCHSVVDLLGAIILLLFSCFLQAVLDLRSLLLYLFFCNLCFAWCNIFTLFRVVF
jgi:hypothetical protein